MLTVASPKATDIDVQIKAVAVGEAIKNARANFQDNRIAVIYGFPTSVHGEVLHRSLSEVGERLAASSDFEGPVVVEGQGFVGIDISLKSSGKDVLKTVQRELEGFVAESELHPDIWEPCEIRDISETESKLAAVVGNRYSYHELDDLTELLQRHLERIPRVAKVTRTGLLPEQITLEYSQQKLAAANVQPHDLSNLLAAHNAIIPGATIQVSGRSINVTPTGEFHSANDVANLLVSASTGGGAVYLRDLVDARREYQTPHFLNQYTFKDSSGRWETTRAITLAVNMRAGEQIAKFGADVDAALDLAKKQIPSDVILARTSDQPRQVSDNMELFMSSLGEAIILVVLVSLVGFWDFRTAGLLALTIPITLLMTIALFNSIGGDLQQVSIGTMILSLGLLVDVPVVAGDAINNELAAGVRPDRAAWIGPTKLSVTILFATLTNIVAYLPLISMPGVMGTYIRSLPIVMTIALLGAWLVSLTFVPTLGFTILRAPKKVADSIAVRRTKGVGGFYARVAGWAIDHRSVVLALCFAVLIAGFLGVGAPRQTFFPKDFTSLSYVDVWLPEDASFDSTKTTAEKANSTIRRALGEWSDEHRHGAPVLESLTTFIGGAGPRFWFSLQPELSQTNYAQVVINLKEKRDTDQVVPFLQRELDRIPGARFDVRQMESAKPIGLPIAYRISGEDKTTLRELAERAKAILRKTPGAERVRDDWGADTIHADLHVDADRANLSMMSNSDVGLSAIAALNGVPRIAQVSPISVVFT